MRLGMWVRRGNPEARWPTGSLVIALVEIGIFMIGGMSWGLGRFLDGTALAGRAHGCGCAARTSAWRSVYSRLVESPLPGS